MGKSVQKKIIKMMKEMEFLSFMMKNGKLIEQATFKNGVQVK